MLMPSILVRICLMTFMRDFPFFDENAGNKIEKKLYGRHAKNMMKTDIKELEGGYESRWIFRDSRKMRLPQS